MLPGVGVFLDNAGGGASGGGAALVGLVRGGGFEVKAVWASSAIAAETAARELRIPFHTDSVDALLLRRDVALVFVACAPSLHAQVAVKALGIGKHVVCARPAGLDQAEALKMVRAAQYYPALISVLGHWLRFLPAAQRMRAALAAGYLGPPSSLSLLDARVRTGSLLGPRYDWLCDSTMGGGALSLLGSHVVDLVSFLTGQRALRVHGLLRTFTRTTDAICGIRRITAPDFCSFQMEMDGGLLVTATLTDSAPGPCFDQEFLACGPLGQLAVKGGDLYGTLRRSDADPAEDDDLIYLDEDDLDCPTSDSSMPPPYLKGLSKMICALKEAFLPVKERAGWIKEPVESAATFEDGQYVQAVMEAIKISDAEKRWVDVSLLAEQPDPNPMLSAAVRRTTISLQ